MTAYFMRKSFVIALFALIFRCNLAIAQSSSIL